jgi:hypothetical protein
MRERGELVRQSGRVEKADPAIAGWGPWIREPPEAKGAAKLILYDPQGRPDIKSGRFFLFKSGVNTTAYVENYIFLTLALIGPGIQLPEIQLIPPILRSYNSQTPRGVIIHSEPL